MPGIADDVMTVRLLQLGFVCWQTVGKVVKKVETTSK